MVDYFNFVNAENQEQEDVVEEKGSLGHNAVKDERMTSFCQQNLLQLKSMKEVHALCLQL